MYRLTFHLLTAVIAWTLLSGCHLRQNTDFVGDADCYEDVAAEIEYPAVSSGSEFTDEATASLKPFTISDDFEPEYWDISLEEVVQTAMMRSSTLHDLGGIVVRAPNATRTQYDVAIQETDPAGGVEAALSAFDAELTSDLFFEKNDRELNNRFEGGGTRTFQQDLMNWDTGLRKRSVLGSEFLVRHHVDYDANTAPGNLFPSAFNSWVEGEIRHPLMQGAGSKFNRIAGPTQVPGQYNGVLIARLNTDIALTEFEIAVRDFVSNLENTYWDLYFSYRDLQTKMDARDAALETWQKIYALSEAGRRGGEAEKEAQAREQFYRFQAEVQNALVGRLLDGTRNNNGSPGGSVRSGASGVLVTERRLRTLMGLPATDGRLLRPSDEPTVCRVEFDWPQIVHEATTRRAELRRQKWVIRRRELELIASKNHLMPRLDAVGRYRWRGFGNHLAGSVDDPMPTGDPALDLSGSGAYEQLFSGDFQEWQLGVELSMPLGFRRAHTGVRNAELMLARERAILGDMRNELVRQAADSASEVDRAYVTFWTAHDRLRASQDQLDALNAKENEGVEVPLHLVLDAQKRIAEAQSEYYRTATEFAVASKNVHFAKGTLLEYDGIFLGEGSWPGEAHEDAAALAKRRGKSREIDYASQTASIVSGGTYAQSRADSYVAGPAMPRETPPGLQPEDDASSVDPAAEKQPESLPPHSELEPLPPLDGEASSGESPEADSTGGPQLTSGPPVAKPAHALAEPFVPDHSLAEELAKGQRSAPRRPSLPPLTEFAAGGADDTPWVRPASAPNRTTA